MGRSPSAWGSGTTERSSRPASPWTKPEKNASSHEQLWASVVVS
jgi:hypothetical protein